MAFTSRIALPSDLSVFPPIGSCVFHSVSVFFPWPSLIFSSVFLHSSHSSIFHRCFNPHVSNHFLFLSFSCRFVTFSCFFPWHFIFPSLWVLTFQLSRRGAALGTRCSWRWSLEVAWWCLGIRWCHLWHPMQCHLVQSKESWNLKAKKSHEKMSLFFFFFVLVLSPLRKKHRLWCRRCRWCQPLRLRVSWEWCPKQRRCDTWKSKIGPWPDSKDGKDGNQMIKGY